MQDNQVKLPDTRYSSDNPYSSSSNLSTLEAEVLGEYSRLAKNLDRFAELANTLAAVQPEILAQLTPLEAKLGMVLTLFKASVWATYMAQEDQQPEDNSYE